MRKTLFIFLVFALAVTACTRSDVSFYKNGNKKHELHYKGDKLEGEQRWYWDNGKLQALFNYKNGLPEGKAVEYYKNGNVKTVSDFKAGILDGQVLNYDEQGNKTSLETYKNGVKQGPYKVWHLNGKLKLEGYFYEDEFDSLWRYYDAMGVVVGEGKFKRGTGSLTAWFPNGKIMRKTLYKNSLKDGVEEIYNKQGELISRVLYKQGKEIER